MKNMRILLLKPRKNLKEIKLNNLSNNEIKKLIDCEDFGNVLCAKLNNENIEILVDIQGENKEENITLLKNGNIQVTLHGNVLLVGKDDNFNLVGLNQHQINIINEMYSNMQKV